MKIVCNDELVLELSETKKKIIKNDIHEDEFDADMKRRLAWALEEKLAACFKRLKAEWEPRLAERGVEAIPTNQEKFAELVFSQPDYCCRATREKLEEARKKEELAAREAALKE